MIERAVCRIENEMAIMTLAEVLFNLTHDGRRQLALQVPAN